MEKDSFIEKLKQYIGETVTVEYFKGKRSNQAFGKLVEVNEKYVVLKNADIYIADKIIEEDVPEVLIRTQHIIAVIKQRPILIGGEIEEIIEKAKT